MSFSGCRGVAAMASAPGAGTAGAQMRVKGLLQEQAVRVSAGLDGGADNTAAAASVLGAVDGDTADEPRAAASGLLL